MEPTQPNASFEKRCHVGPRPHESEDGAWLKSPAEAQKWFSDRGITISEWALARRFNPALVYQVLAGTRKAVRGTSFKIAVELGMKAIPADQVEPASTNP